MRWHSTITYDRKKVAAGGFTSPPFNPQWRQRLSVHEGTPSPEPTLEKKASATLVRRVSPGMKTFLLFLIFLAVCLALHHRGFSSPMIYDSCLWIERKAHVFEQENLMAVLSILPKRPLFMTSLYLNYSLNGMEPESFRWFNAAVVAASGVVLVWLVIVLLRIRGPDSGVTYAEDLFISGSLGILFVVHPLQTLVVLYIWQREAILACFFFFAALTTYLAGRAGHAGHPRITYVSTALLFFAGLNCKENVVSLPLILLGAEALLLGNRRQAETNREVISGCLDKDSSRTVLVEPQTLKSLIRRAIVIGLITVPPFTAYLFTTHHFHGVHSVHDQGILERLLGYYEISGVTFFQVLGTECRVLFSYLATILIPFVRPVLLIEPQTVSSSLWSPSTTLPALLGVMALLAAVPILARKRPLTAFGIFFFFISSAPEALLIPQFLYFGYRAILPAAGVLIVAADLVSMLIQWTRHTPWIRILRPSLIVLTVATAVGFAAMSISQAEKWKPNVFWTEEYSRLPPLSDNVERVPYVTVLVNLAATLAESGDYHRAADLLRIARRTCPEIPAITLNLGQILTKIGSTTEAQEVLEALVRERPEIVAGWIALSRTLMDQGKSEQGIAYLREAIEKYPGDRSLHLKLAQTLTECGNLKEAVSQLRTILENDPHDIAAMVQMGLVAKKSGNLQEAVRNFKGALKVAPGSREALMELLLTERELAQQGEKPGSSIRQEDPAAD